MNELESLVGEEIEIIQTGISYDNEEHTMRPYTYKTRGRLKKIYHDRPLVVIECNGKDKEISLETTSINPDIIRDIEISVYCKGERVF